MADALKANYLLQQFYSDFGYFLYLEMHNLGNESISFSNNLEKFYLHSLLQILHQVPP